MASLSSWVGSFAHSGKSGGFCCLLPSTHSNQGPPSACPPGFHGSGCQGVCECQQGASCDPVSGQCLCPAGFHGQFCEKGECQPLPPPFTLSSFWLVWGWEHRACCPHQGASQAFLETVASSSVTVTKGCPVIPSAASAFARQGVQEPHVTWVSGGPAQGGT